MAIRFQDAHRALLANVGERANANRQIQPDDTLSIARAVLAFDAVRISHNEDALVSLGGNIEARDPRIFPFYAVSTGPVPPLLPVFEGADLQSTTHAVEARALAGEAGKLLAQTLADHGATRLVRVTQWPAGMVAVGDVIYVNAGWLVAMAALDESTAPLNQVKARSALTASDDAGVGEPLPPPPTPPSGSTCSVAGTGSSRERRVFWIVGPLLFVLLIGHTRRWKKRSTPG